MRPFLLDTHIWVWFQRGDSSRISPSERERLTELQMQQALWVSPISTWEMALLEAANKIILGTPVQTFVGIAEQAGGLRFTELSPVILIASVKLPGQIHRDPADRILVATARELGLVLITRDDKLLRYAQQGHLNARKP